MISVYKSGLRRWREKTIRVACLSLLLFFSAYAIAQSDGVGISGVVVDETGEVLGGVSIRSSVGTASTSTNDEGRFTIRVPANSLLLFSYIGYVSQEVKVGEADQMLTVTLVTETSALDEVIVVGYGTQRKESVTGSVASISGANLQEVPSANISQALQGRLPGIELSQTSSKPGAEMQIRVRGTRSLNASNDPLVVLDGIPFAGSIGDINPNDIKSIDILKDASATAIYGSRGANGVILVTTNKGGLGQQARITYSGFQGLKNVFGKYPMMSGPEFVKLRADAGVYSTNGLDEFDDVDTDWQDLLYRTGSIGSHDVNVSGGTQTGTYKVNVGYFEEQAVLPSQDFSRVSLSAAVDQKIGNNIRLGFTTFNNFSVNNGNNLGIYGTLNSSPIADPFNEDGSWKRVIRMPMEDQWVYSRDIIEGLGDRWIDRTKAFGSYNTVYGEVEIPYVEGLKYRINVGLNYRQSNGGAYTGEGVFQSLATSPSTASISNALTNHWIVENLLTYDRSFGKHIFNLTALYAAEENLYNRSFVEARDIPADAFQFYNLGRADEQPIIDPDNQHYNKSGLISGMGRVMYSYDDRYMLTASYRYDGSSRLAQGHKWVSYPAVSAGWNLHNESFLDGSAIVNQLKLRVGYGITSNQSIDPYSTFGLLGTRPYNFGDTFVTGFYVTELPNTALGWEFSSTANYAVDFGILGNRLSGTFEYYHTKTSDLLFRVNLPQTAGVSNYMANVGKSENKGYEFSLHGVILDNDNGWTWEAGVNLYHNRNRLTALSSGQLRDENNWWFVGHPIDVIFDYEAIGLWQEGEPFLQDYEPGGNAGMIKVKYNGDYNADGSPTRIIGGDDRQIMSMEPNFQGGFNTRVAYKGFDLSTVGLFKSGGLLIATPYGANGYLNILTGRRGNIKADYWTPENTDATFPKPGGIGGDQPKYLNSLSYFDASFLKIRTITLGYSFDSNSGWMQSAGINNLRFYFTVQNPFVMFSPYNRLSGMDPETNSYANENSAVSYGDNLRRLLTIGTNTPTTRNYMVGINLTF